MRRGEGDAGMRRRKGNRRGRFLAVTIAAVGLLLTVPAANAATSRPATDSSAIDALVAHQSTDFRHVCAWPPAPGHVACLALLPTPRTGAAQASNADRRPAVRDLTDPGGGCAQVPVAVEAGDCYGPADLESAYNLTSASASRGSGETVAVVDANDDPNAESDLAVYRSYYGLPPCTTANGCFEKVNEEGQESDYPEADPSWSVEISLDLDMVSAICPNCHILLVEASTTFYDDLGASVDTAVDLGAKFVSNSYGAPEYLISDEQSYDTYYNHPGVAVTVAAGDTGYSVNYPAASRYVTSVGGTSLLPASNARGWDEIAWSGTGSGCSAVEPKPAWQTDSGCANRTDNDVAAVADPDTGVAIYDSYDLYEGSQDSCSDGWCEVGGTSAASPIIASVFALAGTPTAGTYPSSYPYQNPGDLNDIVAGTNSLSGCTPSYLCTAGPGYDGPTGLGTPDGVGAFSS